MKISSIRFLAVLAAFCILPVTGVYAQDTDQDGIADAVDNCIEVANPDQLDTDNDVFGNHCDADIGIPNDCIVNFIDLNVMSDAFFGERDAEPAPGLQPSENWNRHADLNGDGIVNFIDLNSMRGMFFRPPGPSALAPICVVQNFAPTGMQLVGDGQSPISEINVGHLAQMQIGITSEAAAANVTVDIMILNKAAYDIPPQNPVDPDDPAHNDAFRIRIDQVTIPLVMAGTHTYPASVLVPYSNSEISPNPEVDISYTDQITLGWWDQGSGANLDGSFWRLDTPNPAAFPLPFSYLARGDYQTPLDGLVAAPLVAGALAAPASFVPIWNDSGSGANLDGVIWQPIPAAGYRCLGMAVTNGPVPPTSSVTCLRSDLAVVGTVGALIWNDVGSGANSDFSAWDIDCPVGSIDVGGFIGVAGYTQPSGPVYCLDAAAATAPIWGPIVAGQYYLYAAIDAEDSFGESNEDDNIPLDINTGEFTSAAQVVDVSWDNGATPNIYIEELTLDVPDLGFSDLNLNTILLLDSPAPDSSCVADPVYVPFNLGVTASVNASGAYWPNNPILPGDRPLRVPRVDASANVVLPPIVGLPPLPLSFWDTDGYTNTYSAYDVEPGVSRHVHLDVGTTWAQLDLATTAIEEALIYYCEIPLLGGCAWPNPPFGDMGPCFDAYNSGNDQALFQCVVDHLLDTTLDTDILAYDAVVGGSQIAEFAPPGFVETDPVVTVNLVPPASTLPPVPLTDAEIIDFDWSVAFGGNFASAGLGFYAGVGIYATETPPQAGQDNAGPAGAFASVEGHIPISLFGFGLNLYGVEITARGLNAEIGDYADRNTFNYDVVTPNSFFEPALQLTWENAPDQLVCGQTLDAIDVDMCEEMFCAFECNNCDNSFDEDCELAACNTCRASNCLSFGIGAGVDRTFVIGIVPLTVEATIDGLVGLNAWADFPACKNDPDASDRNLALSAGPYVDVSGGLNAGVGVAGLLAAGAGADITLINDTFGPVAAINDIDHDEALGTVQGQLHLSIDNTLTGPNGDFYLWAEYPCLSTCRVCFWGCFNVPCPGTCNTRHVLDSFDSFERTDSLFCDDTPGIVTVQQQ